MSLSQQPRTCCLQAASHTCCIHLRQPYRNTESTQTANCHWQTQHPPNTPTHTLQAPSRSLSCHLLTSTPSITPLRSALHAYLIRRHSCHRHCKAPREPHYVKHLHTLALSPPLSALPLASARPLARTAAHRRRDLTQGPALALPAVTTASLIPPPLYCPPSRPHYYHHLSSRHPSSLCHVAAQ